jgi:hypothetical protein
MACRPPRISQCQRTHAPMPVRIGDYDSMLGRGAHELGGSMLRSKILLARLALIPAAILMAGHSSLGEAKGDECKAKPDGTSPAGLHWYYRVDRANNRHCWYLHEQGMRVHSIGHATSRDDARSDPVPENDTTSEQIWKTPTVIGGQPADVEQAPVAVKQQKENFATRWVDLPKSVDLNAHEPVAASNGYAAERGGENRQEQLPPTWASVSAVKGDVRQNTGTQSSFGSISLAGAVVLVLLLMSEALVRFARTSGWTLLRRRADWRRRVEPAETEIDAVRRDAVARMATAPGAISRTETGVGELRRLLQRAGTGLRPPQSFAPSRSPQRREDVNRARAHSTLARLKSRSFSGMTWASL